VITRGASGISPEAGPPTPHDGLGLARSGHEAKAVGGLEDDPGPPDMLVRCLRIGEMVRRRWRSAGETESDIPYAHASLEALRLRGQS
jgi:hypothetical protein